MVEGRVHVGDVFVNHYSSHPTFRICMVLYGYSYGRDYMYKTLHANGHLGSIYSYSLRNDPNWEKVGHINVKGAVRYLFKDYLQKEEE